MAKVKPRELVNQDRKLAEYQSKLKILGSKYKAALDQIREIKNAQAVRSTTDKIETIIIAPDLNESSEAVVVIVASDWHIEEQVKSSDTNGLNVFNLGVARKRAEKFWQNALVLLNICSRDVKIDTICLALLGDFISNDIHEEFAETAEMLPIPAIMEAQKWLASGIEFLLEHTQCNLVIPCHSGNHARTTAKTRFATEAGHSLEYWLYHNLADHFSNQPRVKFHIAEGYHSYIDMLGFTIRFHHGHQMRYAGGVGGLYIPVNKAIAQWNKAKTAYLDVFGHWHQRLDGGNFICNGSLIGYNAFALAIKANYEKPVQSFFLIDKKRGKTITAPIILD